MTYMHGPVLDHRSAVSRLALVLAAAAQLALAFLAPAAEARADRDTRPHVELAGTRLHHAHIESLCPACSAQHLVSVPPSGGAPKPPATRHPGPAQASFPAAIP